VTEARKHTVGVFSIMPKILEISVGSLMERPVSVRSDRNIRDLPFDRGEARWPHG